MKFTIETRCSPDGIKVHLEKPFWVATYAEMLDIVKSVDNLDLDPVHMTTMQALLGRLTALIPRWQSLCRDLDINGEETEIVRLFDELFEAVEAGRNRY